MCGTITETTLVAPLAGSVDRNAFRRVREMLHWVAPLAGSVDRNEFFFFGGAGRWVSLPSRGAWIEITSMDP